MMNKKDAKILFITMIILSVFGIIMITSASSIWAKYRFNDAFHFTKLQTIYFLVSILASFIISKMDMKILKDKCNIILLMCFILLVIVLIPGIGQIRNGSRSWFKIGPFGLQPSEFSKIGLIIYTAKYLAKNKKEVSNVRNVILPLMGVLFLFFGLIMLEPDFGTGMVIVLTILAMVFVSGTKLSFFAYLFFLGLLGITGLIIIAPYRIKRIVAFLNPWSDPLGSGYQIIQSLYAIAPGGLLGLGFGKSIQKQFYLPEPQTDFIFAIISEEFGFLGVLIVSLLFFIIFKKIINISLRQTDVFYKFLCMGLGMQIIIQAMLNLCVVVGLIPVTGVTLPFLSYGGSSLLISIISISIILNIANNKK